MKYGKTLAVVLLMLVCFTGCAEKSSRLPNTNNNVDKVIEEQINSTDQAAAGSSSGGQEVITKTQGESSLQGNGDKTKIQTAIHA